MKTAWYPVVVALTCSCGGKTNDHAPPQVDDGGLDAASDVAAVDAAPPDAAKLDVAADAVSPATPLSCCTKRPGTDRCGPGDDCCGTLRIPGGTFLRVYDGVNFTNRDYPATVSDFWLDEFEVTVGRFRSFVDAYPFSQPAVGTGAHPKVANSGWQSSWPIAESEEALENSLLSDGDCPARTWTRDAGPNQEQPMACVTWYELFAFCAWDGGRLPTATEWDYAGAGGPAQRVYPWSIPSTSTAIDPTRAVYTVDLKDYAPVASVGTKPAGVGLWGQYDLAGNVWEATLDVYDSDPPPAVHRLRCPDERGPTRSSDGERRRCRQRAKQSVRISVTSDGPHQTESNDRCTMRALMVIACQILGAHVGGCPEQDHHRMRAEAVHRPARRHRVVTTTVVVDGGADASKSDCEVARVSKRSRWLPYERRCRRARW